MSMAVGDLEAIETGIVAIDAISAIRDPGPIDNNPLLALAPFPAPPVPPLTIPTPAAYRAGMLLPPRLRRYGRAIRLGVGIVAVCFVANSPIINPPEFSAWLAQTFLIVLIVGTIAVLLR